MIRVPIAVQPRPYEALIERGLLDRAGACLRELFRGGRKAFVVTMPALRRKWANRLMSSLSEAKFEAKLLEMPDGERHKRIATVERLAERLVELGADRNAVIIALGGGVVGDVTGFLASIYMRGVDVVQVPTTVLAQVDASIGGKTGVNLKAGKNLIGTFHQPRAVLIDPAVLSTLPDREFRSGLYEALKCGVIGRPELFERFERNREQILRREPAEIDPLIIESVKLKAEVVAADEREAGLRQMLNFGHTIGHALEAQSNYRRFLHGEAVAWGMIAAAQVAAEAGKSDQETAERIERAVLGLGPLPQVQSPSASILRLLQSDKKTKNGVVHFVLPTRIGETEIVTDVPHGAVISAVNAIRRLSRK
jgi:3-dehydroquinate synthase